MKETLVFHYTNVEMSEDEIHLFFFKVGSVYSKLPHESWCWGGPLRKREKGFLGFAIKTIFFPLFFGSTCFQVFLHLKMDEK